MEECSARSFSNITAELHSKGKSASRLCHVLFSHCLDLEEDVTIATQHTAYPSLLVDLTLRVVIFPTPLDSSLQRYTLTLRRSGPLELRMVRKGDTNPSL